MYRGMNGIGNGILGGTPLAGGGIFFIGLSLLLVGFLAYYIIRNRKSLSTVEKDTPLELLQKRLVNEEITPEQFLELKRALRK
jgi:uncharacterized membrane protein